MAIRVSPRAEAIVVLGAVLDRAGLPQPALRRRTARGIELWEAGAAPLLVLSGGGRGARPEAAAMLDIARAAGVPEPALLVEERSRNTFENAVLTHQLLAARGLRRVILVSDGYHLPRARFLFRLAGLSVVATGAPAPPPWRVRLRLVLRESAAFLYSAALAAGGGYRRASKKLLRQSQR
jgi:uncharacterized SAM-binding protein YcdF (DUF218 family)